MASQPLGSSPIKNHQTSHNKAPEPLSPYSINYNFELTMEELNR